MSLPAPLPDDIAQAVSSALAEDVGSGDLTASLIPAVSSATAEVVCREMAVVCGRAWFDEVFHQLDRAVQIHWNVDDGEVVHANSRLCQLHGPARALLTGERTALNFLQTLSATATRTRSYVEAVYGTDTRILDTRKTLPGLRKAQKYAVVCGGAHNHRMGLYDAILIKENHILAAGSITTALAQARTVAGNDVPVEIEVENLGQLREALAAGATRLLLDNFSIADLRSAAHEARGKVILEASGGVTIENIRAIAETGVDYISVGDLTKSIRAVDLSMRFVRQG